MYGSNNVGGTTAREMSGTMSSDALSIPSDAKKRNLVNNNSLGPETEIEVHRSTDDSASGTIVDVSSVRHSSLTESAVEEMGSKAGKLDCSPARTDLEPSTGMKQVDNYYAVLYSLYSLTFQVIHIH